MRKVFLDDLPRKDGIGRNIGRKVIDWDKSNGNFVRFDYDEIQGFIEIIKYQKEGQYLELKYNGEYFKMKSNNFQNASLGKMLNKYSKNFKIENGTILKHNKRDLIIISREYREREQAPDNKGRVYIKSEKWYKYKCNKCTYEGWIEEGSLIRGCGCSCCYGRTAVLGINTIWDTNRDWVERFGVSETDAKKYTNGSHQSITVKCPGCGNEKVIKISTIYTNKSIRCFCNSCGVSYPEKFMCEILNQLNVNYIFQLSKRTFDWCKNYRYDFYLPYYNTIIETHGEQHYKDCTWSKLIDVQKNDKNKKLLANKNNISGDNYIIIDCSDSKLEHIKTNILKSELNKSFDLSNINWLKVEEFALSNLVKDVCEYWNAKEQEESIFDIGRHFKLSDTTVRSYLNKGKVLGLCNYDGKEEMRKSGIKMGELSRKKIAVFKENIHIGTFESSTKLSEQSKEVFGVNFNIGNISQVCNNHRKSHKGFTFKYIDESQQIAS